VDCAVEPVAAVREPVAVTRLSVRHPGRSAAAPDDVSLVLRLGSITVLTGPSGCGKSTLIDVLLGFAVPSSGSVRTVDRSLVGWVPQEPYLFPGTVASNIALGWPSAPSDAVLAAAHAAALDDLPLDRAVAEGGGGLSAGQRRRVAVARALLPGRPVLLLDEPTAGLDPDRERLVLGTLRAQARLGRAILIAAHHPSVIAIADQIVTLSSQAASTPQAPQHSGMDGTSIPAGWDGWHIHPTAGGAGAPAGGAGAPAGGAGAAGAAAGGTGATAGAGAGGP
jgi:ATP-binding cassette subfamily C protein CydCD